MMETMEQYMSKTRENYGSGVTRPTINQDTPFELKGQFLKELRDNTFSGSEHEDANDTSKSSLTAAEVILFYNGLDVPTRQILDSKGAIPSKSVVDAKIAIHEMAEYSQKWHNGTSSGTRSTETSDGLAAIQAQLNNLGREIKKVNEKVYAAQVGCELCKGPHYTKDCPQKEEGKILEEAYYTQVHCSLKCCFRLKIDNPNITMEEYIRLQEEKALSQGETFNWQTTIYGKMEYYEDEDDCFTNFKTKFLAIVLDNTLTFDATILCEPMVSPLNDNEIDFRISFDESDNEDYTIVYDKNSSSYKIISVNDLKTDSEDDNEKFNMPLFPQPDLEVSYSNDLDFFKDFEDEFPAIVYNDALTSISDFLTEHIISPQHIDEFNNETSLPKCNEKEQNVLYFNDLLPFNVIYPDDLKSDTNNDNVKIDIEQPSGDMSVIPSPNEQYGDLAETMIWYMLKKTYVELIRAF
ncbi:putative reverse transcriptase domain-containing protein [Tanacetum coccineum]